ncbi:M48 family metallopeptidase [Candidatus Saccharibacteria bacterium]|nr:M48 family metallopeptidase [Candidatus Saccharibacteria bacterium]
MPATRITKTYPDIGQVSYYPRRQKNVRLSIRGSEIRVSYPKGFGLRRAEAFMASRKAWIMKNKIEQPELVDGCRIGRRHRLKLDGATLKPRVDGQTVKASGEDKDKLERLVKQVLKKEAVEILPPRVDAIVKRTGLCPAAVRIRYMKSQWGSCTSQKNVCLNSALIYLPDELIDYVIVHELCHLKFLDHSARFWQLVETHLPGSRRLKQELRPWRIGLTITKADKA